MIDSKDATPPAPNAPSPQDPAFLFRSELSFQRLMLALIAFAIILSSTGLNLFLLRQISLARRQSTQYRAVVDDYETNSLPVINRFISDLRNFSTSHPSFAPVLAKYVQPIAITNTPLSSMPPPR